MMQARCVQRCGSVTRASSEDGVKNGDNLRHLVIEVLFADVFDAFLSAPRGPLGLADVRVFLDGLRNRAQLDLPVTGNRPSRLE